MQILEQIAAALFCSIRRSETAASLRKPPGSLDVYELTLRGAAHEREQTGAGMRADRAALEHARALYALDRFEEASRAAREATLAAPAGRVVLLFGAAADIARGAVEASRAWVAELLTRDPGFSLASPILRPNFARDAERRLRLLGRLREAGVPPG